MTKKKELVVETLDEPVINEPVKNDVPEAEGSEDSVITRVVNKLQKVVTINPSRG